MLVQNQKPQVLSAVYHVPTTGDFDLGQVVHNVITGPIFEPLAKGTAVTIRDHGADITEDDIFDSIVACTGDTIDQASEELLHNLFAKTLVYYTNDGFDTASSVFANQSGTREKAPRPSQICRYVPADAIGAAKEFLGGARSFDWWFANLAFFAHPDTLGFSFADETSFDNFKAWLMQQTAPLANTLPQATNQLLADFNDQCHLNGLTESIILRASMADGNDEMSFPRVLTSALMDYAKSTTDLDCAPLPFSLGELLIPQTIVFVNVAEHARATQRAVNQAWNDINRSLSIPIRRISTKKIKKLDAIARAQRAASAAAAAAAAADQDGSLAKSVNIRFASKAPTTIDLTRRLKKVMDKMGTVARSQNSYKQIKTSYARPNRRNPDDFNLQGKVVSTHYKPDIHLYLDTSGSIDESNYEDMVRSCIVLARKLNVSLYVNSFSHYISDCTYLPTKGRTAQQIYHQFQRIPKVTGGTDYAQVWAYILGDKRRRRELSIIVTDFEYDPPRMAVEHPSNLWYVPCSHMDWNRLTTWAQRFTNSMRHIDPNIRKRILI